MSWFGSLNVNSIKEFTGKMDIGATFKDVSQKVQSATEKVQSAMPKLDKETFEKLTLTSPDLVAERKRIDEEERRKESVRNMLSGMLPWETRDPERDILVDECKEAILKLSSQKETFFGPYPMPLVGVRVEEKAAATTEGGDGNEAKAQVEENAKAAATKSPSPGSIEKLKKLEPLPPLLQDFDFDAHVGLIERLLKIDPQLVEAQSSLSGGGNREKVFWRNYFFHCALTRYEAGLSIDEIWSEQQQQQQQAEAVSKATYNAAQKKAEEEEITFEETEKAEPAEPGSTGKAFPASPTTDADAPFNKDVDRVDDDENDNNEENKGPTPEESSAKVIADKADVDDKPAEDYELDELEAEIARELED